MPKTTVKRFSVLGPFPQPDLAKGAALQKAALAIKIAPAQLASAVGIQATRPINVPGHASPPLTVRTPTQGGEARRPAFLRQVSDATAAAADAAVAEPSGPGLASPAIADDLPSQPPQVLGSWALRQTALPLPAKPTGFPAAATKARMTKPAPQRPHETDADAAWRYRFRQKWRREQLRALIDGPDGSPDEGGGGHGSFEQPAEDDMMFGLDDVPAPAAAAADAAPAPAASASCKAVAPAAAAAAAAGAGSRAAVPRSTGAAAAQPRAAGWPRASPAVPTLPSPTLASLKTTMPQQPAAQPPSQAGGPPSQAGGPPAQPTGEVLPGGVPGSTIRKVVMRGRGGSKGLAKVPAPERRWAPPGWTSPARASQAA